MTLHPGDVISYSAGSTRGGPDGFRVVRSDAGPFAGAGPIMKPWLDQCAGRVPMLVQAYPATLGGFAHGVMVDTYLSPRVASRAFQLAARESMPVMLASQPLLAAHMLVMHARQDVPWPRDLLLVTGGYPLPKSLEGMLLAMSEQRGCRMVVIQAYGMAEVDAGCLLAVRRDGSGRPVFRPRGDDVRVALVEGRLQLALPGGTWHDTGDRAESAGTDEFIIHPNPARAHPETLAELESWDDAAWWRRTGYVARRPEWRYQLRPGSAPEAERETPFHAYAAGHDMSWLVKPDWS